MKFISRVEFLSKKIISSLTREISWSTLEINFIFPIIQVHYSIPQNLVDVDYSLSVICRQFLSTCLDTQLSDNLCHKRSVLRRDTNRNIQNETWRRANARNVRLYCPYWQYTDLFIFQFMSYISSNNELLVVDLLLYPDMVQQIIWNSVFFLFFGTKGRVLGGFFFLQSLIRLRYPLSTEEFQSSKFIYEPLK